MVNFAGMMIGEITWLSAISIVIILSALVVSVMAMAKRFNSGSRLRHNALLVLNIVAFIALSGLILRPAVKDTANGDKKVRLITSQNHSKISEVDYPSYTLNPLEGNQNAKLINTPQQLLIDYPDLTEIELVGDGLFEPDWQGFADIKISYKKPELRQGLIDVSWNKRINLGESLLLSGRLQNNSKKLFSVKLIDPAGDKVSETLVRANQYFSLTAIPKLAGLHQYRVELFNHKKELVIRESVHLQVKQQANLRLLVLQSSPSFEIKQLQNWAAENGARMMVKTKISQNKVTTRFTNLKILDKIAISQELFELFDLLIIDGRGLIQLSPVELDWLKLAVENGLGMMVLVDQELAVKHAMTRFELFAAIQLKPLRNANEVVVHWPDNNAVYQSLSDNFILPTAVSIEVEPGQLINIKRLVRSGKDQLLVHQHSFGLGQVALSLLTTTYQWVTSGHKASHSQYWENLIRHLARPAQADFIYPAEDSKLYFEQRLTQQCVITSKQLKSLKLMHAQNNQAAHAILLQTNPFIKNQLCGYFWPEQSGWYQINNEFDKILTTKQSDWSYVERKESWLAMQQQQKIRATLAKLGENNAIQSSQLSISYQAINLWYFWWLFFVCASLIWLERKFN